MVSCAQSTLVQLQENWEHLGSSYSAEDGVRSHYIVEGTQNGRNPGLLVPVFRHPHGGVGRAAEVKGSRMKECQAKSVVLWTCTDT